MPAPSGCRQAGRRVPVDAQPLGYVLAPAILVVGCLYLLLPLLPMRRPWQRQLVFAVVWLVVLRYMAWRLFDTVLPASGDWVEIAWVWFCYAVELVALGDAMILYLSFLRSTDRRAEADRHEARLRALPPESLPSVDVYIATYNEPIEVLEKTIVSALALDYPNHRVWVLDDGRRPWLKAFCHEKGAGYIIRPDNKHAKAGNINHALTQTDADFVAVFDADFIPQRNFLMRTLGFFEDPEVGVVQVPHAFYNHDPMQANLAVRKTLPDDQRFFFESIMPSRDGWDAAFCCGSNSVTRRSALRAIGDGLPSGSITEDMLLSLALLRKGFVTRYLCERLAFGLAPESIAAFFVQRQRWARGAMQILYLPEGPLGPGLRFMHRLLFLPTHWLTQSLMLMVSLIAPVIFLWTGLAPLVNVTVESCVHYLVPSVLALFGGLMAYAPRHYFPLAAQVLGTFQSFKLLPAVLQTLVRPHGLLFKVTPKGSDAGAVGYERGIFWAAAGILLATTGGVAINAVPDWRIVEQAALVPLVASWCGINIIVLLLVCMLCLQMPIRRGEERFEMDEPVWLRTAAGAVALGRIRDVSLSGVGIVLGTAAPAGAAAGDAVRLFVPEVGYVAGRVARGRGEFLGVQFDLPSSVERDLLIRKIFTGGLNTTMVVASAWSVTIGLLRSIWTLRSSTSAPVASEPTPAAALEKLPACTLVEPPVPATRRLADLAEERRALAA
jgi:cellulose synthase (UDP-forming)